RPLGKSPSEPAHPEATTPGKRVDSKIRVPVRYCLLGSRDLARNPHTLVEVTSFAAINKFQPFNVAVSSNVLFLLVCGPPCPGARGSQAWAGAWGSQSVGSGQGSPAYQLHDSWDLVCFVCYWYTVSAQ
ncbi:MPND isoform 7, partial [Pongo abelii]